MAKEIEIPIVYLWLYKKFLEQNKSHVRTHEAIIIIRNYIFKLNRTMCYNILRDMEKYRLLQRINQKYYRVLLEHEKKTKLVIDIPFLVF